VTQSGRVEEAGNRKLNQLILADLEAKRQKGTPEQLQAELRRLQILTDGSPPLATVLETTQQPGKNIRRERIRFETEPGITIEGDLYIPLSAGRKLAVLFLESKLANSLAEQIAEAGHVVLTLEVRDSPGENDHRPFLGNWQTNERADQIGRNLPAMRAHALPRGVDWLAAWDDVDSTAIRAAARGVKGIWLLLAAATDSRIGKVWLDRTPFSLRAALEHSMNTDLFDAVIPGFALHWDLDDLVRAVGDRKVLWTDPSNWMGRPVAVGPAFRYRYVLGDETDLHDEQDNAYLNEFLH
jgi:hypothetical protein